MGNVGNHGIKDMLKLSEDWSTFSLISDSAGESQCGINLNMM